jgi:hypothetical protein
MLSMKLRNSHLRNLPDEAHFTYGNKVIVMVNPTVSLEKDSEESWQYECDLMEASNCKGFYLVKRQNFVNVKF